MRKEHTAVADDIYADIIRQMVGTATPDLRPEN